MLKAEKQWGENSQFLVSGPVLGDAAWWPGDGTVSECSVHTPIMLVPTLGPDLTEPQYARSQEPWSRVSQGLVLGWAFCQSYSWQASFFQSQAHLS